MTDPHRKNSNRTNEHQRPGYSIGEVSKRVNLSQKTIRDYEKMGLIRPMRNPRTNNRIYSDFEVGLISHIRYLLHEEGFTLSCLRRIFQLAPCWNVFDCAVKKDCPAYKSPHVACYETREHEETLCEGSCEQCAFYLNRTAKKKRVMDGPVPLGAKP